MTHDRQEIRTPECETREVLPLRVLGRLLAVLAAALLSSVLLALPAAAAQQVVTITDEGLVPTVLQVASGDTVLFVNESGAPRRVVATSDNWDVDSGLALLPQGSYEHPDPITEPGTYTFTAGDGEPFAGSVVLPAPSSPQPSPPPADGGASPAPAPGESPAASPAPAESPAATGGTGTALPPITGGFGGLGTIPSPAAEGIAPPPAIALPELPGAEESGGPLPQTAPEPGTAGSDARPGRLASPVVARGYGLPAALGAVLIAGVVSLLVRLLLAEPAARRGRGRLAAPAPVVTAD